MLCLVAQECGGCPRILESAQAEQEAKLESARRFLDGLVPEPHISWDPGDDLVPYSYRNRIRLRIDDQGVPRFFNENKGSECFVLLPSLRAALNEFQEFCSRASALEGYHHVELRAPDLDGRVGGLIARSPATPSRLSQIRDSVPDRVFVQEATFDRSRKPAFSWEEDPSEELFGRYRLAFGVHLRVPPSAFMQVNATCNERLVTAVVHGMGQRRARQVLDLYCGAGNFLLPLAAQGLDCVGVEIHPHAIQGLHLSLKEQGIVAQAYDSNASALSRLVQDVPDAAIVDPPRAGLADALDPLGQLKPKAIAYVSCNLKSLARDLKLLFEYGYRAQTCTLFNMFPHTNHVESLTWLERLS